jgi:cell division protein FtsB
MSGQRKKNLSKLEKKRLMQVIVLIGGVSVLFFLFVPGRSLISYQGMRQQVSELTMENKKLVHRNQELREEIERLQHDDEYLEKIARERHGLLKKNEKIYEF